MQTEIVIIGGNPGGCSAAIAAARSGRTVLLLEPTRVLGGINANGVFGFDSATPQALSGIAQEVEARVKAHYAAIGLHDPLFDRRADQVWESHVVAKIWHELVAETEGLEVLLGAVPVDVVVDDGRITEVHWQPAIDLKGNIDPASTERRIVRGGMFVDASYEGDVFAWAGAPFSIGREARSALEPHAGRIFSSNTETSPEGWMPHSILPDGDGAADDGIMAFACRLHCRFYEDRSDTAPHRLASPPPGYDPSHYSWTPVATDPDGGPVYFNSLYVLVNHKFLVNRMVRGNNLVGPNRDYILAHPKDRAPLRQRFYDHALGYLYFIQTEGGTPQLGLADDEFTDHGHIPYQLYIREGRRIEGHVRITEADISPFITGDNFRPPLKRDAIAIGDWMPESHGCTDVILPGHRYPEGWFLNRVGRSPYQIPYGAIIPKGIDNLIVPGGISATHVAFSATRCEAARIHMGIAAGVAGAIAFEQGVTPIEVPVATIQSELIRRNVKLTWFADVDGDHADFEGIQWAALRGFLPLDQEWRFFPDHPISWGDFVKAIVLCLELPISVSGAHFEGIDARDELFRYVESLYDFGCLANVDLFASKELADEDPMRAVLRYTPLPRLIPFSPNASLKESEAFRFLVKVAGAVGKRPQGELIDSVSNQRLLTRGRACSLLGELLGVA
ncbi:MAG: FAD-dependent oxidoreductase [Rhizorhabdus sp.]|nr:MAG: FAD-dependent oxidoreductase [Rhizorhabdus sp.]